MSVWNEKANEMFLTAIDIHSAEEQASYLDRVCAGDADLRTSVETLLKAHAVAGTFLESSVLDSGTDRDAPMLLTPPGTMIGRYKILEPIGEGGYGAVFMAEQTSPVQRKVAMKIIKAGMDTRQVIARFEAERQALALMDHPNIAKVFDAGTTETGRLYFVMELVKGMPITKYCDEHRLAPRDRLELFMQVCQAVQHAHQKGIIHRDLKPSNVLVAQYDGKPVPKVIDFGVAKAAGQQLTERTMFTGFGDVIGTPQYMSPEQAELNQLDIDTRSDIYSLGVLLYELLTGTTPLETKRVKEAALLEVLRVIREEEPPKPSTRLTTTAELPSIAAHRGLDPRHLAKLVHGELDWIVMKALEKDRSRRYETANGFASDIGRYLADEQVLACPPSTGYRLKKFARRNKGTLVTASIIGLAMLLAVGSFGWAVRDRGARQAKVAGQIELIFAEVDQLEREQKWPEALVAARRAEAVLAGGEADATTARRVREQLNDLEFIDQLEQIRMKKATWIGGKFDMAGAEREYARAFGGYGVPVDTLPVERSIELLKARPPLAVPLAAALDDWADALRQSKGDAASSSSKRLVAVARGIDPEPLRDRVRSTWIKPAQEAGDELARLAESIDIRAQPPGTLESLAQKLRRAKRSDAAVRLLRDAQSAFPGDFWINFYLAQRLADQNDHEGAVRFYTAALSIRPSAVAVRNNLGMALEAQKKVDEAIAAYREAIEIDPGLVEAYNNLGLVLRGQGKLDEAMAAYRKAIELRPRHPYAHNNLGALLCNDLQDHDQAVACFRRAIEGDPKYVGAYFNLGIALSQQGKVDEAIAAYRNIIELDPQHSNAHYNLGCLLSNDLQDYDEAVACFRGAIELDPTFPRAYHSLGITLAKQKKLPEAVAAIRKAIELDPEFAPTYKDLGVALRNQGKLDEAVAAFSKASELDPKSATAFFDLGIALKDQGKLDEAIAAYREAIGLDPRFADAFNNLGNALSRQKKMGEAIVAYHKAIELDPKSAGAYYNLGSALQAQGKLDDAVAAYRKAIEIDPKYANAYGGLGNALRGQKKPDAAAAAYRKSLELAPNADIYNNLGALLCDELKEYDQAIECFRKAIEIDPKFASTQSNLGIALQAQGKLDEAVAAHRKAIEIDPKNASAHYNLGIALSKLNRPREALDAYTAALEIDPKSANACNDLAWLLATCPDVTLRDPGRAVALAKRGVELDPKKGEYLNTLGVACYRTGDWNGAVANLEKSMELRQGGDSCDFFFLAMARWQLGEKDAARESYDKAVKWMEKNAPRNEELIRFRNEAAAQLGVNEPK